MNCLPKSPPQRRYTVRLFVTMLFYIGLLLFAKLTLERHHLAPALTWLLAALPGIPIVAMIGVVGLYLTEEKDEFERAITVQCMLWATGITLAVDSVWGFLEIFANATHFPTYMNFGLFWFAIGIVSPLVRRRYR